VDGPNGWEHTVNTIGRLNISGKNKPGEVNYGVFNVQPLTESRVEFELDIWELDNVDRGAKDINFDALDEAAKKIAQFEEEAVYKGFKGGGITGLSETAENSVNLDTSSSGAILNTVSQTVTTLNSKAVGGPYTLIAGPKLWTALNTNSEGYPLRDRIQKILGGNIIYNPGNLGNFVVSTQGGDFELTIGQDLSIGYMSHTSTSVKLFLTETFTFRVIAPEAAVVLK